MQIAIEGMDGVGKTSIAQYIRDNYNFKFVEKPLHYFYNDGKEKNYNDLRKFNFIFNWLVMELSKIK